MCESCAYSARWDFIESSVLTKFCIQMYVAIDAYCFCRCAVLLEAVVRFYKKNQNCKRVIEQFLTNLRLLNFPFCGITEVLHWLLSSSLCTFVVFTSVLIASILLMSLSFKFFRQSGTVVRILLICNDIHRLGYDGDFGDDPRACCLISRAFIQCLSGCPLPALSWLGR